MLWNQPTCRLTAGTVLHGGNPDKGRLAIAEEGKIRNYQILTSAYVGPLAPRQTPAPAQPLEREVGEHSETIHAIPAVVSSKSSQEKPSGDSSVGCGSSTSGCVMFLSEPQGADIYLDGKFVGNTPSMLTLAVGSHELRIETRGFQPWTRSFEATAGSKVTIRATLQSKTPDK
jgi:hypothetical protein